MRPSANVWDLKSAEGGLQLPSTLNFNVFADRLRFLHSLLVKPYTLLQDQFQAYLQSGCKMFATEYGALVQLGPERMRYYLFNANSGRLEIRDELLPEAAFYHDDSTSNPTRYFSNNNQTGVNLNNLTYNGEAITQYLGTNVTVSGSKFGVLSFYSVSQDGGDFAPHDIETVELMAKGVARMIELQTAQTKPPGVELGGFATPGVKSLDEYIKQARLPEVFGIPGRVVEVLQRRIGHSPLAIDHIAEELNLSKRTLQRRLQQQDINFAQLRDQVRFHVSIDYLIEQNMSIDSISASLDFSDRTSFTNAFKRWTGLSPSTFRKLFRDYT